MLESNAFMAHWTFGNFGPKDSVGKCNADVALPTTDPEGPCSCSFQSPNWEFLEMRSAPRQTSWVRRGRTLPNRFN